MKHCDNIPGVTVLEIEIQRCASWQTDTITPSTSYPVSTFIAPNGQDSLRLSPEVNQPTHKTDHSSPISSRVKYEWSCTYTPPISSHSRHRESYCTFMHLTQYDLLPEL